MSDHQEYRRPVVGNPEGGNYRNAEHLRGDNTWIREQSKPLLKLMCTTYGRRRLYGIVIPLDDGREALTLATVRTRTYREGATTVPLAGWDRMQEHAGVCTCGHQHAVDLAKVREALDRLRHAPAKSRVVDVLRVSPDRL